MCDATKRPEAAALSEITTGAPISRLLHELNNPLTNVVLLVSRIHTELQNVALRSGDPGIERALASCGVLREVVSHLQRVVRGIGEVAHGQTSYGLLDVGRCLALPLELARRGLNGNGRLVTELGDVPRVWGDATRLSQVFLNLLDNAVQALPRDGSPDEHEVRVSLATDDQARVVVEVADTGVGVAPDQLARIFDPYVALRAGGTGLGLSIARAYVYELGGALEVQSAPGEGSVFRVLLPAVGGKSR